MNVVKWLRSKVVRWVATAFIIASIATPAFPIVAEKTGLLNVSNEQSYTAGATVNWYDPAWLYRKSFTVTSPVASYASNVTIGESATAGGQVNLNSHGQVSFDDLAFTTADGTTRLNYWLQGITGTTPNQIATVWIQNNSSANTTGYVYYGNSLVSSGSSGYNTFTTSSFFDSFGESNWNKATGSSGGINVSSEHSAIYNNVLYQVGSGVWALDPATGATLNHWLDGTWVEAAPVLVGDNLMVWAYGATPRLWKINITSNATSSVTGPLIDFELLTTAKDTAGNDLVFIPYGGSPTAYVCAFYVDNMTVKWGATATVSETTHHWDGGLVQGGYLYTRQEGTTDNKLVKLNIDTGAVVDSVNLDSEGYYAPLLYDADRDQIILTERTTVKVKAFDAQNLSVMNWSKTLDETTGWHIMYGGVSHNGAYFQANKKNDDSQGYMYALSTVDGHQLWKYSGAAAINVSFTNTSMNSDYIFAPTHDYYDGSYMKMMVLKVSDGTLYDEINQSSLSACASPIITGGMMFLGMWDDYQVNARRLGRGDKVDCQYKVDASHTGYVGSRLVTYDPDKSPADLSKWTVASGSPYIADGVLVANSTTGAAVDLYGTTSYSQNSTLTAKVMTHYTNTGTHVNDIRFDVGATGHGNYAWFDYNGADAGNFMTYDGAKGSIAMAGWSSDVWHTVSIYRNAGTSVVFKVDDANTKTISTNIESTNMTAEIQANAYGLIQVDWVLIKPVLATEPEIGSWGTEEGQPVATVVTNAASDVTNTSATLQGNLTDMAGFTPIYIRFDWGTNPVTYGAITTLVTTNTTGLFTAGITGLSVGGTYHFRAVAIYTGYQGATYVYGNDMWFIAVSPGAPTVLTGSAIDPTTVGATLQGTVTGMGGYSSVVGFYSYGTTTSYLSGNTSGQTITATGAMTPAILNTLSANTTYHFIARVQYGSGTIASGGDATFITNALGVPTVTTGGASNYTTTSVTIAGTITSLGSYTTVLVSMEYGLTSGNYTSQTTQVSHTTTGAFSAIATPLNPSTTYHYRAVLQYGSSNVTGSDKTFTTLTPNAGSDDLNIVSAKVFSDYLVTGDLLFTVEYVNTSLPYANRQDPAAYFAIQLVGTDNTTVIASTPMTSWGNRPGAIYVGTASATAITFGGAYYMRILGTYIGAPSATYLLTSADWRGTNLAHLDSWVINTAWNITRYEAALYPTEPPSYVTWKTNILVFHAGEVLTDDGGAMFTAAIPYLMDVRPNIFLHAGEVRTKVETGTAVYDSGKDWATEVGPVISGDMTTIGGLVGLTGRDMNGVLVAVALGVIAVIMIGAGAYGVGIILVLGMLLAMSTQIRATGFQMLAVFIIACAYFFKESFFSANK